MRSWVTAPACCTHFTIDHFLFPSLFPSTHAHKHAHSPRHSVHHTFIVSAPLFLSWPSCYLTCVFAAMFQLSQRLNSFPVPPISHISYHIFYLIPFCSYGLACL
ncbi:hypothetical protein EDB83DRAFT_1045218 [Lactarius deliciosus]|nr:hypothetical protein EDB83DRAFT_1045218 [Lactarius deliciosus]